MHDKFEMSMMGELNFFLGLQIKQIEDEIFFNQSKYIKEMLKKFGLEDSKPTKTSISTEIKLTKDDEADSVDSSKYRGTKMSSEYQYNYKKTRSYALKIYNDPNMSDTLRDIYITLESRYVHEGRPIDPSFYNDLSDDLVARLVAVGFDCLLSLDEQICPRLVPSCFMIFDLEPSSLSFDFVFSSEIFKFYPFVLIVFFHLAILCLDHHAHTLHHFKSLLTISFDILDILKEDLVYQSLRKSLSLCLSFLDS
nr:retrovirus-related Pol polyprotein from transposon TNT 1-94 [Tanacetum cinerariifolium]